MVNQQADALSGNEYFLSGYFTSSNPDCNTFTYSVFANVNEDASPDFLPPVDDGT